MRVPIYILILWIAGAAFCAGAIGNYFGWWGPRSLPDAELGGVIAVVLYCNGYFFLSQTRQTRRFEDWLIANRTALQKGFVMFGDILVGRETETAQYLMVVSFIKFSLPVYSRPFFRHKEAEKAFWAAVLFSFGTLVFGWWEIPWGPVHTIKALWINLRGGKRKTIGELLGIESTGGNSLISE